jgi:hypothetical protein
MATKNRLTYTRNLTKLPGYTNGIGYWYYPP